MISYLWLSHRETRVRIILAVLLTFVMIGVSLTIPLLFKRVINLLATPHNFSHATILLVLFSYGVCLDAQ
jgi:hypothetical protein